MSAGTRPCDRAVAAGRMNKAEQFFEAAKTIREFADDESDVADVYVTLCVHAGIAAADVVCCTELGKSLRLLLTMKTRAGYSHRTVAAADRRRAGRAAEHLVRAARQRRPMAY